jgi:hypothetical protein
MLGICLKGVVNMKKNFGFSVFLLIITAVFFIGCKNITNTDSTYYYERGQITKDTYDYMNANKNSLTPNQQLDYFRNHITNPPLYTKSNLSESKLRTEIKINFDDSDAAELINLVKQYPNGIIYWFPTYGDYSGYYYFYIFFKQEGIF